MDLKKITMAILLILIFQFMFIPTLSNAQNMGEVIQQGDAFVNNGKILIDQNKLKETMSFIFNSLFVVGMILSVFVGGFLGIKYMTSSVEDKAEIKKTMLPFATGCIVIFGAYGIWKIVITILNQIT